MKVRRSLYSVAGETGEGVSKRLSIVARDEQEAAHCARKEFFLEIVTFVVLEKYSVWC